MRSSQMLVYNKKVTVAPNWNCDKMVLILPKEVLAGGNVNLSKEQTLQLIEDLQNKVHYLKG